MFSMQDDWPFDKFGKEECGKRIVIDLAKVMPTREHSPSGLLSLPDELLTYIVELLADDKLALKELARSNKTCRWLARTVQFEAVHFDYSDQARALLIRLRLESDLRVKDPEATYISSCIRRIKVASVPAMVKECHLDVYKAVFNDPRNEIFDLEHMSNLVREATSLYKDNYLPMLVKVIGKRGLPNLQAIVWKERFTVDAKVFQCTISLGVQALRLSKAALELPCTLPPIPGPSTDRPLRHLHVGLDLGTIRQPSSPGWKDEVDFYHSLFEKCASTLHSLYLTSNSMYQPSRPWVSQITCDPCGRLLCSKGVFQSCSGRLGLVSWKSDHMGWKRTMTFCLNPSPNSTCPMPMCNFPLLES